MAIMVFFLILAIYAVYRSSDRKIRAREKSDKERYKSWEDYVKSSEKCAKLIDDEKYLTEEYDTASKTRAECLKKWNKLNKER